MTVAIAIYQNLFCRYLAPGECIIHDLGPEFCNKIVMTMMDQFGVDIRMISAGRPQGNGQAEKYVDILKEKMKAIMAEISSQKNLLYLNLQFCAKNYMYSWIFFILWGEELPDNWDQTIMHTALMGVRTDPSTAHGYAPSELLLGRKLVYPIELKKNAIDLTGNYFTSEIPVFARIGNST